VGKLQMEAILEAALAVGGALGGMEAALWRRLYGQGMTRAWQGGHLPGSCPQCVRRSPPRRCPPGMCGAAGVRIPLPLRLSLPSAAALVFLWYPQPVGLVRLPQEIRAPVELVRQTKALGRLPVVNFAAGGVATPADAALMMQLGMDGVFVGSGIFKSGDPAKRARAIVQVRPACFPRCARCALRAGLVHFSR
jgi:hypothetical protein